MGRIGSDKILKNFQIRRDDRNGRNDRCARCRYDLYGRRPFSFVLFSSKIVRHLLMPDYLERRNRGFFGRLETSDLNYDEAAFYKFNTL